MFRTLTFIAMGQQHHQTVGAQPFGLACRNELVDHGLSAIGEVAKLRFPQYQRFGFGTGIAIFIAEHAKFGQRTVQNLEPAMGQCRQGHIFLFGTLVDPDGMPLAEGAASGILPRKTHAKTFGQERAEGQRFAGCPVEIFTRGEHRFLGIKNAAKGRMDIQRFRNGGQCAAQAVEQLFGNARFHIAARRFGVRRLGQPRPASAKPVRRIGLIIGGACKFLLQQGDKAHRMFFGPIGINHAFGLQPCGIDIADARVALDHLVHQRLREAGLIAFIMAEATVAPHVDHDIAVECLAEFDRDLARKGNRFGVVAVHVENRGLNALGNI